MIAALVRFVTRHWASLRQPPAHREVIAESQRLRHDLDTQIRSRRHDAAMTRIEQKEIRRSIRQNFVEVEMRPDLRRDRRGTP